MPTGNDYYTYLEDRNCIVSSYETQPSERNIHLHLYNRYSSERYSTYERYYVRISEKNALAERELIYDERTSTTISYDILISERSSSYGRGYVTENDERNVTYERWFTLTDERNSYFAFSFNSERQAWLFSKYNTFRYAFAKSWYVSERYSYTYGKPYTYYADQRNGYIQLTESPVSEIQAYNESCSVYYSFNINPLYSTLIENKQTEDMFQTIVENETVTPYTISYRFVQIKDIVKHAELGFIEYDAIKDSWNVIDLGRVSILRYTLKEYLDTNTYYLSGFIIPIHNDIVISIIPICGKFNYSDFDNITNCHNAIKEAQTHGYFRVVLGEYDYHQWGRKLEFFDSAYQPILFEVFVSKTWLTEIMKLPYFNILLKFGYPMKNFVHKIMLSLSLPQIH